MQPKAYHIQDVLKDILKGLGGKAGLKRQKTLDRVWEEIVGETLSSHTRILGVRQKVIRVKVDSAPLLNELANFKKQEILSSIREKLPDKSYQDIKFIA